MLLQDWQEPVPALTLGNDVLEVVESFVYLGSCITAGGNVEDKISLRIQKARLAFANLRNLWRRYDVSLSLKGRVYNTSVRAMLLYGYETWPLRAEDVRKLFVFDNRCLRTIARVWWEHRVSNEDVRRRVFGTPGCPLSEIISVHRLRWLGHVL